ncbi:hypothetical protein [Demequina litorisediminis]|uniref:hypothetical protein n=1 Tax=Demequina litorisediminis TaxID=1849022 RepID=UPI0024E067D9|nr:hypothetical protein [Demequina litorisediminis]
MLAAVTLAQGAIGYFQYFTGLPEWLVALHLAGLGVFAAAHSASHFLLKTSRNA